MEMLVPVKSVLQTDLEAQAHATMRGVASWTLYAGLPTTLCWLRCQRCVRVGGALTGAS